MPRPFQCFLLIKKPNVQIAIFPYLFTGQKSKCTDTVINLYEDHAVIGLCDDSRSIEVPVRVGSITAALNEKPHRQFLMRCCFTWRKDIDEKTVLVGAVAQCWARSSCPDAGCPELEWCENVNPSPTPQQGNYLLCSLNSSGKNGIFRRSES